MPTHKKKRKSYMDIPVVKELYSIPDKDSQLVFGAIAVHLSGGDMREWLTDRASEEKLNYFVGLTVRALNAMK